SGTRGGSQMKRSMQLWSPCALLVVSAAGVFAQAPVDELVALEGAVHRAVQRVAPTVVTIETFGGTRRALDQAGKDADGKDVEQKPVPDLPGRHEEEDKPRDETKKLGPIKMPGFIQAQGATTGLILAADGWILT